MVPADNHAFGANNVLLLDTVLDCYVNASFADIFMHVLMSKSLSESHGGLRIGGQNVVDYLVCETADCHHR